jgi:hypothetical protein
MSEDGVSWDVRAMQAEIHTELNMLTARHELHEIGDEAFEIASSLLKKFRDWR